jgi:CheY-like chemotaxis protein
MSGDGTVLVIDDDEDVREIVAVALEAFGIRTRTARDGVDGLQQLKEGVRPSVVLLDLRMPSMNGEAFLRTLRESLGIRDVPVVVMSGDGDARRVAARLDTQGFLAKPVELPELVEVARRFVSESTGSGVHTSA